MRSKKYLVAALLLLATAGQSCLKGGSQQAQQAYKPIELNYWRVYDGEDTFSALFEQYNKFHPNITISYRQLRYEEYEKELLNALAEDRGPDIFAIHNTWMKGYQNKILPMPSQTVLPTPVLRGTIKKEQVIELLASNSPTMRQIRNDFVDQVASDVIMFDAPTEDKPAEERIWGLPLGVDSLAMFYNKDLLNNAGISTAPATWNQFQEAIKKLTKQDAQGNILLSGAAIGASKNVVRANDLLAVLMMQNGAAMSDDYGYAFFNTTPPGIERDTPPGAEALRFYTDFANPSKEVYTWNSNFPNSLDAFVTNRTAVFFGYSFHLPIIKARAPKLNLGIAKLPQIEGNPEVNFANYWVEVVSRRSSNSDAAWNLIQFLASKDNVKIHLDAAKKPTALRALINEQVEDLTLSAFAQQVLTAKSWYRGSDANAAEKIFGDMIDQALAGAGELTEILNLAAGRINQTIR